MHSTDHAANTTRAAYIIIPGQEALSDGLMEGNPFFVEFTFSIGFVFTGAIIQSFAVDRGLQLGVGQSTQHDFEARWERVEHRYCLAW